MKRCQSSKVNRGTAQCPVEEREKVAINQSGSGRAATTAHWTEAKIKAKQFPHNIDHTAGTPLKPVQMRNDTGENQLLHGGTHLELELKG